MNIILGLVFLSFNFILLMKNRNKGIFLYILLSFISPHISIQGFNVSYEILGFALFGPFLLLSVLAQKKDFFVPLVSIPFVLYVLVYMFATLISINKYGSSEIFWIAILGNIRVVFFVFMALKLFNKSKNYFEHILLFVLMFNLFLTLSQLFFPESISMFHNLYFKESQITLRVMMEGQGKFSRMTGSFGSPVYLAGFSLVGFSFYLGKILQGEGDKNVTFGLFAAIICGLLSVTKTFFIGVPIIFTIAIMLYYLISSRKMKHAFLGKMKYIIPVSAIFLILIWNVVGIAIKRGFPMMWYYQHIFHPFKALETRYGIDGNLIQTMQVVKDNLLIGVGATTPFNELISDSFYIIMLHDTGLVGAILIGWVVLKLMISSLQQRNISNILIIVSLLLTGFSYLSVLTLMGVLVFSYSAMRLKPLLWLRSANET